MVEADVLAAAQILPRLIITNINTQQSTTQQTLQLYYCNCKAFHSNSKRCIEWDPTLVVQIRISPLVGFYACGIAYVFELAIRELSMGQMGSRDKTMVLHSSHNKRGRSITHHTHAHTHTRHYSTITGSTRLLSSLGSQHCLRISHHCGLDHPPNHDVSRPHQT